MPPRHPTASAVLTAALAVLAVGTLALGATPALAAPITPAAEPAGSAIPGDLTGDGIRDVTVLGSTGGGRRAVCTATIRPGPPGGGTGTGPGTVVALPVQGQPAAGGAQVCPDLGVVLAGRTAAQNLLAVTYSTTARRFAPSVQVFALGAGGARHVDALAGQVPTTGLHTLDFDGDGVGDLWQSGGQGFTSWTHRGADWLELYRSGPAVGVQVQFLDLNRGPGRDVVVSTAAGGGAVASVVAVDGVSSAAAVLADGTPVAAGAVASYRATFLPGADGYLDVIVTPVLTDGSTTTPQVFDNRSQRGRWSFVRPS